MFMHPPVQVGAVAVVGAGIVGLSVAHELRRAGGEVHVYERGVPGNGQSGGESRIFRHAHDDPRLVELAKRSRAIWREWEDELGIELVSADGVVALGEGALEKLELIEEAGGVDAGRIDIDDAARPPAHPRPLRRSGGTRPRWRLDSHHRGDRRAASRNSVTT